jgi:hypothetical protein
MLQQKQSRNNASEQVCNLEKLVKTVYEFQGYKEASWEEIQHRR